MRIRDIDIDVGDILMLVTIDGCWWLNFDVGDTHKLKICAQVSSKYHEVHGQSKDARIVFLRLKLIIMIWTIWYGNSVLIHNHEVD